MYNNMLAIPIITYSGEYITVVADNITARIKKQTPDERADVLFNAGEGTITVMTGNTYLLFRERGIFGGVNAAFTIAPSQVHVTADGTIMTIGKVDGDHIHYAATGTPIDTGTDGVSIIADNVRVIVTEPHN